MPLIIGQIVHSAEPIWDILMNLREIVELVMSVQFSEFTLSYLERKILEHVTTLKNYSQT